jgi:hypothetical protein
MIGKRCAWNKGKRMTAAQLAARIGRKRSKQSRARMRAAAQRRARRRAAVQAHEQYLRRHFIPLHRLQRIRETIGGVL